MIAAIATTAEQKLEKQIEKLSNNDKLAREHEKKSTLSAGVSERPTVYVCVCECAGVCVMVVTEKLRKGRSNNGFPGSVARCRSLLLVNVFFFLREII